MTKPHCICPNGEHLLSCPVPTVDGWEGDFWYLVRGMSTERKNQILKFIRATRAQAKAEAIAEVVKIVKGMELVTAKQFGPHSPFGTVAGEGTESVLFKSAYNAALTDLLSRISNK